VKKTGCKRVQPPPDFEALADDDGYEDCEGGDADSDAGCKFIDCVRSLSYTYWYAEYIAYYN
jgi:hypothetical protein